MKLVEYELNRAIRLGEFVTGAPKLFGSNLIRALVTRYGFVQAPTTAAEFNFQTGITFQHGYFKNQVIDRLQIYNNGLFAEAKADTDISDAFLDDAIEWAKKEAGIGFRESPKGGIYLSQVVVQTSASLPTAFKALQAIAARISSTLSAAQNMPAEVSGFQLQSDPAEGAGWTYRFERRVGRPFADQTFFSSAPLQTGDHLKLLEQMEADFSQS